MTSVVIIGAGGFGREVWTYLLDAAEREMLTVAGFLNDDPTALDSFPGLPPILGPIEPAAAPPEALCVIGIGEPRDRWRIAHRFEDAGVRFMSVVHPTAYVAASARIERGVVVAPHAVIGPFSSLGAHTVVNVAGNLGHDAELGRCVVMSPHSVVNGASSVEDGSFLGSGSIVGPRVRLGAWSRLAAGAVITRDAEPGSLIAPGRGVARVMLRPPEGL